jgi:ribosomal protein S27AE
MPSHYWFSSHHFYLREQAGMSRSWPAVGIPDRYLDPTRVDTSPESHPAFTNLVDACERHLAVNVTPHNDTLCMSREIFDALQDSTISSFLKFMAHKYTYAPVKTGMRAVIVPDSEKCPKCGSPMLQKHRTGSDFDKYVRVLWSCQSCSATEWKQYGEGLGRERRSKSH